MRRVLWCAVLIGAVAGHPRAAWAQQQVVNARAESLAVSGTGADRVGAALRALASRGTGPLWAAWTTPAEGRFTGCCWESSGCEGCRLEPTAPGVTPAPLVRQTALALEGDRELVVLVRIEESRVERLRTVGVSCPLDAGGLPFVTLTGVSGADSVAWLRAQTDTSESTRAVEKDKGLAKTVEKGKGLADAAVHAIGRHADPAAVPALLDLARHHAEPRVRGSALVALAQAAGRRAAPDLVSAADRDPDTEVKRRAVFAISQLPKDEAVPLLIRMAREHTNSVVRRQAMFWLGQSKDPRAIEFFASILKG
jgi:HEAT repeats